MTTALKSLCARFLTAAVFVAAIPAISHAEGAASASTAASGASDLARNTTAPTDTKASNKAAPQISAPAAPATTSVASASLAATCPETAKICVYGREIESPGRVEVSLGDYVILATKKPLAEFLAQQKDRTTNKLGLFINDIYFKDVALMAVPDRPSAVMFLVKRTSNNQDAWSVLFTRKGILNSKNPDCATDDRDGIQMAAGFEDGTLASEQSTACLEYFPNPKSSAFLLVFALGLVGLTLLFAARTSLLRDPGIAPPSHKTPWSLARVQMALWTISVICAVLYVYAVTGDNPTIPDGILILMGIGAGTAVSGFAIDSTHQPPGNKDDYEALLHAFKSQSTLVEDAEVKLRTAQAGPDPSAVADAETRLAAVKVAQQATRIKMKPFEAPASKSFIFDVLSDENGIAFHRLQLLGWTMTYWIMFIAAVLKKVTLTNFEATQLALMGISGATYLGFKLSEKPKDPGTGPQGAGPPPPPPPPPRGAGGGVPGAVPGAGAGARPGADGSPAPAPAPAAAPAPAPAPELAAGDGAGTGAVGAG